MLPQHQTQMDGTLFSQVQTLALEIKRLEAAHDQSEVQGYKYIYIAISAQYIDINNINIILQYRLIVVGNILLGQYQYQN